MVVRYSIDMSVLSDQQRKSTGTSDDLPAVDHASLPPDSPDQAAVEPDLADRPAGDVLTPSGYLYIPM